MPGLLLNQGQTIELQNFLNKVAPQDKVLRLYKNNYTPVVGSIESNFTEADFTGYVAITMSGASWSISGGSPATATYPKQSFTSSANQATQQIYGYYITELSSGKAVGAELFPAGPYPIANNLDELDVTPNITQTHA